MTEFQHLAMYCSDPLALEAFYTRHFGFRRARVFQAGTPQEFAMIRLGGMCLELFRLPEGASTERPDGHQPGYLHLAFEVDDIEATIRGLEADGIAMLFPIQDHSAVIPGLRINFFRDPDGNLVELMEGWKDEANPPEPPPRGLS